MEPLAPWEKVYIKLVGTQTGFDDIDPTHALVGCIGCHGGTEPVTSETTTYDDRLIAMNTAHGGELESLSSIFKDPSVDAMGKCAICHEDITNRNEHSTHSMLWGERYKVAFRYNGSTSLDACPAEVGEKFDGECMSCHTTCGQCHVSRPNSVGGGFVYKHKFRPTPSMANNCTACHGSRIGTDFNGDLTGNHADVHNTASSINDCLTCHTEDLHGDGTELSNPPITRYAVNGLPTCEGCHADVANANLYHTMHWSGSGYLADVSCFVCHSQPYNNCNSCHTAGEWKGNYGEVDGEIDTHSGDGNYLEYPAIKIGHNPAYEDENGPWSPSLKLHSQDEWILVRHIPIVHDTYENWNAGYDSHDLNTMETWEYTSPHNINRWTAQTDTTNSNGSCFMNCHLNGTIEESIRVINKERFLFDSDLEDYEKESNENIKVDSKIPASWE